MLASIPRTIPPCRSSATPVAVTHRELQGSPSCSARKTATRSVRPASATSPARARRSLRSPLEMRPAPEPQRLAVALDRGACRQPGPARSVGDEPGKRLIVGHGISLSGEITACDRLVVDGSVQVTLNQTRAIEITESGRFTNGKAEVEEAEISGVYEGDLTVRNRLLIRSTGQVKGTVRYGEIEVERGGRISGSISMLEPERRLGRAPASRADIDPRHDVSRWAVSSSVLWPAGRLRRLRMVGRPRRRRAGSGTDARRAARPARRSASDRPRRRRRWKACSVGRRWSAASGRRSTGATAWATASSICSSTPSQPARRRA